MKPSRPIAYRAASLVLALLVLAASIGLPVQRRTCRLSGRSTVRVAWRLALPSPARGDAAPGQSGEHSSRLTRSCYAYAWQLHQVTVVASVAGQADQHLTPAAAGPGIAAPAFELRTVVAHWAPAASGPQAGTVTSAPARPGGRALLVRGGVLIV